MEFKPTAGNELGDEKIATVSIKLLSFDCTWRFALGTSVPIPIFPVFKLNIFPVKVSVYQSLSFISFRLIPVPLSINNESPYKEILKFCSSELSL